MSFRVDGEGTPGRIDVNGPKKASYAGIYRLDGDELTVCLGTSKSAMGYGSTREVARPGGDRPAAFDPDTGTLVVLKRLKD